MSMAPQQLVAEAKAQIQEVDANSAAQRISTGTVVIDVREPGEFDAGHLPNAVNIPRGVLEFKTGDHPALANKDAVILVYCKYGWPLYASYSQPATPGLCQTGIRGRRV